MSSQLLLKMEVVLSLYSLTSPSQIFPVAALGLKTALRKTDPYKLPFLNLPDDIDVIGPIAGISLAESELEQIRAFRSNHVEGKYLSSAFHKMLEDDLSLDRRSFHFIVK